MFFLKNRNITIFFAIAALMLWANVGMAQTEWVKYPGNPVLDLGESGTWDDYDVLSPTVLFNGTEYQMWYSGNDGSNHRIGYATSGDGVEWEKYHANPVLDLGESGTWDDSHVHSPTIFFDGIEYHMWYSGYDGSNWRIGYAISADGIAWVKHPDNPVLDPGESGTWDDYHVDSPTVLFNGTEYQMWYKGSTGSTWRIGYAISADGIVWVKHPDNPVLDLGESGTWDDSHVLSPTVLFNDTEYQMWYSGLHQPDGFRVRIGYAISADGIAWVKHPDNPVLDLGESGTWDDRYVDMPTVLFNDTEYQMWYSGHDGSHFRIGYATSTPLAGTVTLVDQNPPLTWNYRLTHNSGAITQWTYTGAAITSASVDGDAQAAGWSVQSQTNTQVVFSTTTPLTSNSLTGFHITGTASGTGSWTCGSNSGSVEGPLPVELSYFNATVAESGIKVILKWRTATETNNLGFNIYRSDAKDGKYIKVNARLIAGAGSDATPHNYSFTDENVVLDNTYYYYIEDIDFSGETNRSHIIEVTVGKQSIKTHLVPPTFALLQNYPNPFNPETWIPYKLAYDSPITISIYNAKGQMIRAISLGTKQAGVYVKKDKAAYWDGRDSLGQKVASGIYYYTLQAGEFRATRKMVILK